MPTSTDVRHVYTDGGHRYDYGAGAWLVDHHQFGTASFASPDAVYSETMAVVLALEALDDPHVVVHTDASQLAYGPHALVSQLRRLWQAAPLGLQLVDRLEAAVTGRKVFIERTCSKGDDAVPQMRAVDALERYTRQLATLSGRDMQLNAMDLPIEAADANPVLETGWGLATFMLPDYVEIQTRTCAPLGSSHANKVLTAHGL